MRKYLLASAGLTGIMVAACCGAQAASYIPVPLAPGAATQTAFAINNSNIIAGAFKDSVGVEHGFVGPLDGSNYTVFDSPVDRHTGTEPRYLGDKGTINGFAAKSGYQIGVEFFRHPNGNFINFKTAPHTPMDGVVQGINNSNYSVGDYFNSDGIRMGFVGRHGVYKHDFDLNVQNYTRNSPRGIKDDNTTVAGLYDDQDGVEHGFVQVGSNLSVVDYPSDAAFGTVLEDINNSGLATGQWTDSGGNPHGFIIDTTSGDVTDLDPGDGSTFQQAWGINEQGLAALSTSAGQSYIYCPLPDSECPSGGVHAIVHKKHVPSGAMLHYDRFGRTGHGHPLKVAKKGAVQ
ncbi:MAG: hypothetical protein JO056_09000 [Alphaproteobacteria bacterium]|nr:hypothetical protein [Alphaproteobacteria bacterium]